MSQPTPGLQPCTLATVASAGGVPSSALRSVRGWQSLLLGLLGLLMAGCASTPDKRVLQYLNTHGFGNRYSGDAEEENYVTIGDSFVWANEFDPGLSGQATIDIDGTVVLPQVGSVHVAGMTRSELEAYLTLQLSRYYTEVDIRIRNMATQGKVYFVFGECGRNGPVPFRGELTIFEAVLAAKPTDYAANLGRVRLVRGDPRDPLVITVNFKDILDGDTTFNILVKERDILIIPPTFIGRLSNFLGAIVTPFGKVLNQITTSLFQINRATTFGVGNGNLGNNNNNLF
ncbi:MAG: polysaccharide biosynthesis/export family protein [Planctomycetota bacterium]|jgi:polysaccharide export outer membrane protein